MKDAMITYPDVQSSMKNWRKKSARVPQTPHTMEKLVDQLNDVSICESFNLDEEKFIHLVPSSCERAGQSVALFTESGLKAMQGSSKALMDGTFKFFPTYMKQLFIIHSYIGNFVSIN